MKKCRFLVLVFLAITQACFGEIIFNNAAFNGVGGIGLATNPGPFPDSFYSIVQPGNAFLGFTCNTQDYILGDDFVIEDLAVVLESMTVYAFEPFVHVPIISGGFVKVFSGGPNGVLRAIGAVNSVSMTNIYRSTMASTNDNYQVQQIKFDFPSVELPPGSYFVSIQLIDPLAGPYIPPVTKNGEVTFPGANARYFDVLANEWSPLLDGANKQELPFILEGTECTGRLYAYNSTARKLFSVNMSLGTPTLAAEFPGATPQLASFAYDPANQRLFASSVNNHSLYRVFLDSETTATVGSYGFSPDPFVHGIEWDTQSGTLWGAQSVSGGDDFFSTSPSAAGHTVVGPLGFTTGFNNLGFDSTTNTLYCVNTGTNSLYRVSRGTGATTLIGPLVGPTNPSGLAYSDDIERMFLLESDGNLWKVDVTTGNCVHVGDLGTSGSWLGLVYIREERDAPTLFSITSGSFFGGTLASLKSSDEDKVYILCDESSPNGAIQWDINFCYDTSTRMHVHLETQATRSDITEFVDLFNWQSSAFANIGSRTSSLSDVTSVYHLNSNVDVFNGDFGLVRGRMRFIPQADLEAADGWSIAIDQIRIDNVN